MPEINVRITKIEDLVFNGNHPNGIDVDFEVKGYIKSLPEVGREMTCYTLRGGLVTTQVVATTRDTFTTLNSIYKLEIL